MDRRERAGTTTSAMLAMQQGWQSQIWTALPGIIQSFDPVKKTCQVQPSVQAQVQNIDQTFSWVSLPLLLDCPVQFPSGGGCTLTFPLAKGDECLVVFGSRCIDLWWQNGGIKPQAQLRMHDLSDGFVIPGVSSVPNVQPAISTSAAELRSNDGTVKIALNPTTKAVTVNTPGSVSATAGADITATATGNINLAGANINLTGVLNINGHPYLAHAHSDPQGGNTGGVV